MGAVSLTMLLAAGCGSSSSKPDARAAATPTQTGSATTTSALAEGTGARITVGKARQAKTARRSAATKGARQPSAARKARRRSAAPQITRGNPIQRPAAGTGGDVANDDNPAAKGSRADSGPSMSKTPNPCALVSQAQVQTFTGKRLAAPKEAPLGPTCIYQESGAHAATVTVVVESLVFSQLKPHVKKLAQSRIGGQTAYCGVYGATTTFVPLSRKRVLSITAPCPVGAKFAAAALPKLGA
jgi:hypothetical protein